MQHSCGWSERGTGEWKATRSIHHRLAAKVTTIGQDTDAGPSPSCLKKQAHTRQPATKGFHHKMPLPPGKREDAEEGGILKQSTEARFEFYHTLPRLSADNGRLSMRCATFVWTSAMDCASGPSGPEDHLGRWNSGELQRC